MIWKLNILSCSYMFYSAEQTKGVSGFLLVPNILLFDSCPTLNSTISPQIRLHSNTQTRNSYCTLNHICSTWVEGKYLFPHSTHARICFFLLPFGCNSTVQSVQRDFPTHCAKICLYSFCSSSFLSPCTHTHTRIHWSSLKLHSQPYKVKWAFSTATLSVCVYKEGLCYRHHDQFKIQTNGAMMDSAGRKTGSCSFTAASYTLVDISQTFLKENIGMDVQTFADIVKWRQQHCSRKSIKFNKVLILSRHILWHTHSTSI